MKCRQFIIVLFATCIIEAIASSNCNITSCTVLRGRDGRDGRDGHDCVECAKGPTGPKGEKGDVGAKGDKGVIGAKGNKGNVGSKGGKGDTGAKGDKGVTGLTGMTGKTGEQGPKGDKGIKGICDQEELATLLKKIATLEANLKRIAMLEAKVEQLQKETVKLDKNNMIKQSLLPGGYSKHNASDLQWQSIHMAAAAACRGSTPSGGTGCCWNKVYPRLPNMSCTEVCGNTYENLCDAELSIHGYPDKVKTLQSVGVFYRYGCEFKYNNPHMEPSMKPDDIFGTNLMSYCCCRKG